jgi:hypothetical protein
MERKWIRISEGVIGLEGIGIQMRYDASKDNPFVLVDTRGAVLHCGTLEYAKMVGEEKAAELEQMGLA